MEKKQRKPNTAEIIEQLARENERQKCKLAQMRKLILAAKSLDALREEMKALG